MNENERVNIMTPAFRADPYTPYAAMRREAPVCQVDPGGMWAVSRYADVVAVLRSPERFSSQGFRAAWQPAWVGHNPLASSILAMDGPDHARLRGLVSRSFGAPAIARVEQRTRALCERLAARLDGEVDFIDAVAAPLPAFVICELLGLDHALEPHFKRWIDDLLSVTPEPASPEHAARVRATIAELDLCMAEVIEARRRSPADDLATELTRAEAGGKPLDGREIIDLLVSLLGGGLETTTHFLGSAMLLLAERPAELERLRTSPELIPKFVEEMMRYDGPTQSVPRLTTSDVALAGAVIPAGSLVLALVGSANRDELHFKDPDRFELHRGQPSLTFGHGAHFCLGAALARMEAKVALEVLIPRIREVTRAPGEIPYNRTLTVRGPVSLPLRFRPA
ncbi:cytochrome P450 [Sorangium sp. So ce131]|uniref:cytochrome P450 n=1 Tax=Sorangium sp. So ce131 TaxID=3133282 RepID=UPI003F616142